MKHTSQQPRPLSLPSKVQQRGFALISTISIMVLLVLIVIGMLALSTTETKKAKQSEHQLVAQANARMALMIALSEAQEALGPDRRISAYATILDTNAESDDIDGVNNPRLLGVWDSWGAWLNADYTKDDGTKLNISDTYDKGRSSMFRRWLVSGSDTDTENFDFAKSGDLTADSVTLVGQNSVKETEDHVRARLIDINDTGRGAWWVGGRNQAADVKAHGTQVVQDPSETELSSGDNGSFAIDAIEGFESLPSDPLEIEKVINHKQLELASVDKEDVLKSFFDVTQNSAGVIADVRWGGLKKDLNLLFEQSTLPSEFQRNSQVAPSPRPMSSDLLSNSPKLANRGFTSFEQMREFYRSYKSSGTTPIDWDGRVPSTKNYLGHTGVYGHAAESGYRRMPVVAKYYSIYSRLSTKVANSNPARYDLDVIYSTIVVLWNPYNMPLEIADGELVPYTLPYKVLPSQYIGFIDGNKLNADWIDLVQGTNSTQLGSDAGASIRSDTPGEPIVFAPGQFRIFSKKAQNTGSTNNVTLEPGYDPNGAFGQKMRVYSNKPLSENFRWGVAVRLNPKWNRQGTAYFWGGNPGGFANLIWRQKATPGGTPPMTLGTMYDWTANDYDDVEISGTGAAGNKSEPAVFDMEREDHVPFCVVGMTIKASDLTSYGEVGSSVPDYRSKNWIQSLNSASFQKMNVSYSDDNLRDMQRLDSGYRLHFLDVDDKNGFAPFFNVDSTNKITSLGPDEKVYSAATLEVPSAPITSVSGFAGMRLTPGWYQTPRDGGSADAMGRFLDNTAAYVSGVPGIGVGNSFAQPTIQGTQVYKYHNVSEVDPRSDKSGEKGENLSAGVSVTDSKAFSDYWDHALLVNDGLWDSWFTSSMTDATRPSATSAKNLQANVEAFLKDGVDLPYKGYEYWKNPESDTTTDLSETLAAEGYKTVAGILKKTSAFNVNSTSVDAWLALFTGLKERDVVYRDGSGNLQNIARPNDGIILSRFITSVGDVEVDDPRQGVEVAGIGKAWTGVREISDDQLLKLAEECVKQVKQRGPFLNMSDFINRRLTDDEAGLTGALQAAIDYDDESPDPGSINYRYKEGDDMIPKNSPLTASYPNQKAAGGSRYTGAPGYVVQSDLLRPLGNALTVRDDSFVIRAYGESLDKSGKVMSKAWCEAVVQRTANYVDSSNLPQEAAITLDQNGNPSKNSNLSTANQNLGRRLEIVSFRWLSPQEI